MWLYKVGIITIITNFVWSRKSQKFREILTKPVKELKCTYSFIF